MKTLNEAIKEFEGLFERVKEGWPTAYCETGDRYIVVTSDGIQEEGGSRRVGFLNEEAAIEAWLVSACQAVGMHGHTPRFLYWRRRPALESEFSYWGRKRASKSATRVTVYSRFLATDAKPDRGLVARWKADQRVTA